MGSEMDDIRSKLPDKPDRFVDQLRTTIRKRGLSYSTEKTYVHWVLRFIRHSGMRHPSQMGPEDVTDFLDHISVVEHCATNTQRIALNAMVFLYDKHLGQELGPLDYQYARKRRRMPTVFAHDEALAVIRQLRGTHAMVGRLMYGSGLRVSEAVSLRIKDLDFRHQQLIVRDGKGSNERMTLLPATLYEDLQQQIDTVRALHAYDTQRGYGSVFMPDALNRKYPNASRQTQWQFLFPAQNVAEDPRSGTIRRHHMHASTIQRAVAKAIKLARVRRRASSHTFRHSFATRLIETGYDIKLVQSLLGHRDIRTTEIYLHVVRNRGGAIKSPIDR
ncbi:MAG: integron integrase [Pseudomonadota bacterium]